MVTLFNIKDFAIAIFIPIFKCCTTIALPIISRKDQKLIRNVYFL